MRDRTTAGGLAVMAALALLTAGCGEDTEPVRATDTAPPPTEASTTTSPTPTVERLLLPDPDGQARVTAWDPAAGTEVTLHSFYADPENPDAGYLQATWWDSEPALPAGSNPVDIDGRHGQIQLAEGLGQLSVPTDEGWVFVVSSDLDLAQLEAAGEAAAVEAEGEKPLVTIGPAGLPEGWRELDADPMGFVGVVQADDPTLADAWVVRYDQAEPHEGTDLHTAFVIIGQPENDDLIRGLEAVASEHAPIDARGTQGVSVQLGHLGTTPPIYMQGFVWNEAGQTILAVGLNWESSDVAAAVEDLETPSPEAWTALTE